jgi:hypothetical protein
MANKIFYNPAGYVEVVIEGDQTYMSFENLKGDASDILEQLQKDGKPRRGILDITKQGNYTADTNRAAMEILESLNYDRLAIFGGGKFLNDVAKAIILAMGKSGNTKIFPDREAAVEWVLSDSKEDDGDKQAG